MYTLYVMMGYPGSGKSTFARNTQGALNNCIYVSSDDLRLKLFGFLDQTRNTELFAYMYKMVIEHHKDGDCIYDATNLTQKVRKSICAKFKKYYRLVLICVVKPILQLMDINQARPQAESIPMGALRRMLGQFEAPTFSEGWEDIKFYYNPTRSFGNQNILSCEERTLLDCLHDYDHDNPHHQETIKQHIMTTMAAARDINPALFTLARYHDLGKFFTRRYNETKGYHQYIGHNKLSGYIYLTNRIIDIIHLSPYTNSPCVDYYDLGIPFWFLYYAIVYHDIYYVCKTHEEVIKSLSKPSKAVCNVLSHNEIEELAQLLKSFNQIDNIRGSECTNFFFAPTKS